MATPLQQTVPASNVTASNLVDWIPVWSAAKKIPIADVTRGTPLVFSTAVKGTNAGNYVQQGSINWAKNAGNYTLGWTVQTTTNIGPSAGWALQQWVAPQWVAADPKTYAIYYNSVTAVAGATSSAPLTYSTIASTFVGADPQPVVGLSADTTKGLTAAVANQQVWTSTVWNRDVATQQYLVGYFARGQEDTGAQFSQFKVGGTVNFRAGFKSFPSATLQSLAFSTTTTDFSFALTDSTANNAAYVTLGAVFAALTAISF